MDSYTVKIFVLPDTDNFKLIKVEKEIILHSTCADGYFYNTETKENLGKEATTWVHYLDNDGNELDPPITDNIEWRKE